jgi:hypothetical protein
MSPIYWTRTTHRYDPTCGCRQCDPVCPECLAPIESDADVCACGHYLLGDTRVVGEDDGLEYGDPRDERVRLERP